MAYRPHPIIANMLNFIFASTLALMKLRHGNL